MTLREATKGYKSLEKLIGKYDLDPALDAPSPLEIDAAVKAGNYKTANQAALKTKLENAVKFATTAAGIAGTDTNHQLRITTYNNLIAKL